MRNIVITFYNNKRCYIYYCDQDINIIWYIKQNIQDKDRNAIIGILNDDTVIIEGKNSYTFKSMDKDIKWPLLTEDQDTEDEQLNNVILTRYCHEHFKGEDSKTVIPYGDSGFISYDYKVIYVYDDNLNRYRNIIFTKYNI